MRRKIKAIVVVSQEATIKEFQGLVYSVVSTLISDVFDLDYLFLPSLFREESLVTGNPHCREYMEVSTL